LEKKLGIVTLSHDVGIEYKNQLNRVFGSEVVITTYSLEKGTDQQI